MYFEIMDGKKAYIIPQRPTNPIIAVARPNWLVVRVFPKTTQNNNEKKLPEFVIVNTLIISLRFLFIQNDDEDCKIKIIIYFIFL